MMSHAYGSMETGISRWHLVVTVETSALCEGAIMLPDWQSIENRLFASSKAGILRFAAEHSEATCSFFAYSANPVYGEFHLCFDTHQNALERARHNQEQALKRRSALLEREGVWRHAHDRLTFPRIIDYSPDPGVFAYPDFVELVFEELEEIGFDPDYPESPDNEDGYANGNGRLVIWKVLERLLEEGVFSALRLASPFRLGYKLHDDSELVVLHIFNWPQAQD